MFTKANIRNGSTYLSVHLSANDYYSQGEKVNGQWFGKLAERFGIAGRLIQSDDPSFENLRLNLTPDGGAKLTPKKPDIRFFDFQCSAQKSVSIMAVIMGDARLRDAHGEAVKLALSELEQFAACRARQGASRFSDRNRITGNICAAIFHHDASRALDPQLHTHAVVANATYDPESGRILALSEREMLKAIRYAGKVYQNAMATEVQKLGYEIDLVRKNGVIEGFEIAGVSSELCQRFSKRRVEIEAGIKAFIDLFGHEPSLAEIHTITTNTRSAKLAEISTPEVIARQKQQLSYAEFRILETIRAAAVTPRELDLTISGLQAAVNQLFERKSVFRGHEILAEALNQGLGAQALVQLKDELKEGHYGLVSLFDHEQNLSAEFATRVGLEQEQWCRDFINRTQGKFTPQVEDVDDRLAQAPELREDQRRAAEIICTSKNQVAAVRGLAGSGKTYMLRAVNAVLTGQKVYYIAPTSSAVKTLLADGIPNATACADFLENIARKEDLSGATVICDEASLQSNNQGFALLNLAQRFSMRIRFVGDSRQHVSVEAGDFLRVMEAHSNMETAEVSTIERQKHEEYRKAVICLSAGQAKVGLEKLSELGWLIEGKSNYIHNAARDYVDLTSDGLDLSNCVAVAPTWNENYQLTSQIRSLLKKSGLLADGIEKTVHHSLKWTRQQKQTARNYTPGAILVFNQRVAQFRNGQCAQFVRLESNRLVVTSNGKESSLPLAVASAWDVAETRTVEVAPGDQILIRANSHALGLTNGDRLTIGHIDADGTLHTREGKQIPPDFKQWCHGYVVTSYKAQGVTANNVVVAASMLDQKTAYVACSRGRQQCLLHTPNAKRLMERLPPGDRKAALEVVAEHPRYAECPSILARIGAWLKIRAQDFDTSPEAVAARIQNSNKHTSRPSRRISH